MKTTEQLATKRFLAQLNFEALGNVPLTPRLATRYNRLRYVFHACTLELQARLDGRFVVSR